MNLSKHLRASALPALLLATTGGAEPPRCSCLSAVFVGVVAPADVTLPAGSAGLRVYSRVDPDSVPPGALSIRTQDGGVDLDLEFSRPLADGHPNDWFVAPVGGFEPGRRYVVSSARVDRPRPSGPFRVGDPRDLVVTVSDAPRPALAGLTLDVGEAVIQPVTVVWDGGSCSESLRAVARRVAVRFPEELAPYRETLQYETLIDGDPWYVRTSWCDTPIPGVTRGSPGTDLAFAACDDRAALVRQGSHTISMRVRDIRTGEETVTPEVPLELVCADDLPEVATIARPAIFSERYGEVRSVIGGEDGEMLSAIRGGGVVQARGSTLERFTRLDGLPSDEIADITLDREGRLWAVGVGGWAVRENGVWRSGSELGGLSPGIVFDVSETPDGALWFSTDVGAARLAEGSWTLVDAEDGLPGDVVHATLTDRAGSTWFACENGLARRDGASGEIVTVFDDVNVRTIVEGLGGDVWFGTSTGALRWDGDEWHRSLEGVAVYPTFVDADGSVWAGSADAGVFRTTPDGWASVPLPAEYRGAEVFDVAAVPRGRLLATERGLAWLHWPVAPEDRDSIGVAGALLDAVLPSAEAGAEFVEQLGTAPAWFCLAEGSVSGPGGAYGPLRNRRLGEYVADHLRRVTALEAAESCRPEGNGGLAGPDGEPAVEITLALEFTSRTDAWVLLAPGDGRGPGGSGWSCRFTLVDVGVWRPAQGGCRSFAPAGPELRS